MLIKTSPDNMNQMEIKNMVTHQIILKKKSFSSKIFRIVFNFEQIEKSKQIAKRPDKFNEKLYEQKKGKLRENMDLGKNALLLIKRIKKKSAPGKFYKISVQNIAFFNKEKVFVISNKKNIDGNAFYWLTDTKNKKLLKERFQRHEPFAVEINTVLNKKQRKSYLYRYFKYYFGLIY